MAGDPALAEIWADADVYTGALDATNPANPEDPFGAAWDLVGLLDGDEGFTQARDEDVNDLYAWGGILVRTSRRNFKQTVKFVALEDNDTVRDLVWPASTDTALYVPRPADIKVAFETREGSKIKRLISHYRAQVVVDDDIVDQESDLTKYTLLATIFPSADGWLFDRQSSEAS